MSEVPAEYVVPGKQAQVDRLCDEMLEAGERPSIEKVRKKIGGSPNTLLVLIDNWWRRLGERVKRGSAAFERLPGTLALQAEAFFLAAVDEARAVVRAEEATQRDAIIRNEDELRVRGHVLSLREEEFAEKLEEREQRTARLEEQLRENGVTLRKTLATKDALLRQVDELRITVATLQAQHAASLAGPRTRVARPSRKPVRRPARKVIPRAKKRNGSKLGRARRGR
jgi:hypothetical protein